MTVAEFAFIGLGAFLVTRPLIKKSIITDYDAPIEMISIAHGNDPLLVKAIIKVESDFNPNAHALSSVEDSRGLGQIRVNDSNKRVLANLGIDPDRLYDPEYNITAINLFLDDIKKRYTSTQDIISAYNAGAVHYQDGEYSNLVYVTEVWGYYTLYQAYN